MLQPFHLAIPVDDLHAARGFYGELFGCEEGRSSDHWIDYNFFGHQLVVHMAPKGELAHNPVDGKSVPVPHFGVVLAWDDWHALADKLTQAGCEFVIEPESDLKGYLESRPPYFCLIPLATPWNSRRSETWISCSRPRRLVGLSCPLLPWH